MFADHRPLIVDDRARLLDPLARIAGAELRHRAQYAAQVEQHRQRAEQETAGECRGLRAALVQGRAQLARPGEARGECTPGEQDCEVDLRPEAESEGQSRDQRVARAPALPGACREEQSGEAAHEAGHDRTPVVNHDEEERGVEPQECTREDRRHRSEQASGEQHEEEEAEQRPAEARHAQHGGARAEGGEGRREHPRLERAVVAGHDPGQASPRERQRDHGRDVLRAHLPGDEIAGEAGERGLVVVQSGRAAVGQREHDRHDRERGPCGEEPGESTPGRAIGCPACPPGRRVASPERPFPPLSAAVHRCGLMLARRARCQVARRMVVRLGRHG